MCNSVKFETSHKRYTSTFFFIYLCSIVSLLQCCVANVREGGLHSVSVPLQLTASCYSLFKLRLVDSNLRGEGLTQGSEERYSGIDVSVVVILLKVVHFLYPSTCHNYIYTTLHHFLSISLDKQYNRSQNLHDT